MTDDAGSSRNGEATSGVTTDLPADHGNDVDSAVSTGRETPSWERQGKEKRLELLEHLLHELDTVIYAELAAMYYMDCSFLRFLLRAAAQLVYLTPKPSAFPDPPSPQPSVGAIFGTSIICVLSHVLFQRPAGTEATRGYLHGGAVIDFIGTEGPTWKLHLLILDVLAFVLQIVMLCVHVKCKRLRSHRFSNTAVGEAEGQVEQPGHGNRDLDAEERGVLRERRSSASSMESSPQAGMSDADPLMYSSDDTKERVGTPGHSNVEALSSGQTIIVDLYLLGTIRTEFWAFQNYRVESYNARSASARRLAEGLLGRRVGLAASLRATTQEP